jgi:hypothetical protein
VTPTIPHNLTVGQIRYTIGLVSPEEYRRLGEDERAAVSAFSLHLHWRTRQQRFPAFEGGDETILTVGWMRRLLRAVGARKTGSRAAAAAITWLEKSGLVEDTGQTMKPRRRPQNAELVEPFGRQGREVELERRAQSLLGRCYWWRVFRVPALARVRASLRSAYPTAPGRPLKASGFLSAFVRCQAAKTHNRRRSRPNPGSPQWAFRHSGPP